LLLDPGQVGSVGFSKAELRFLSLFFPRFGTLEHRNHNPGVSRYQPNQILKQNDGLKTLVHTTIRQPSPSKLSRCRGRFAVWPAASLRRKIALKL